LLGKLGAADPAALQQAAAGQSGELAEWLLLAQATAGARNTIPQVRQVLRSSEHADVRMEAADALGTLKAREALPELRTALDDPDEVSYTDDLGLDHTIYPVREQAAAALGVLGIKVERLEDGQFQVSGQ
jgi:HEAT repeat protein